jgi:hypothetical protein
MIWDFVQGLGAVVGLMTGGFVLLERFTKHRPVVIVVAPPFGDFKGAQRQLAVRFTNPSDRPILVESETGAQSGHLRLAQDDSIRGIVTSLLPGSMRFPIDAGATKEFPLLKPPRFAEMDENSECLLQLRWRFAQPILWRAWRSIKVSVTKESLMVLLEEEGEPD